MLYLYVLRDELITAEWFYVLYFAVFSRKKG